MDNVYWFGLAAIAGYFWVKNQRFGPGESFSVGGTPVEQGVTQPGPAGAIGGAVNETGGKVGAALDSVANAVLGATITAQTSDPVMPQPSIGDPSGGGYVPRTSIANGDGGIVTAYDDAAGYAALRASYDAAPLGVVDAKPEQSAFGVSRISPWGGGLYGVTPPKPRNPQDPAFSPLAGASVVSTKTLSPRIGRIGK